MADTRSLIQTLVNSVESIAIAFFVLCIQTLDACEKRCFKLKEQCANKGIRKRVVRCKESSVL